MNYLAHIFLSGKNSELMVGNVLGDIISQDELHLLPIHMQYGVLLHRHIDSYTDHHSANKRAVRILRKDQHKYAPVAHDIMMDYLLYKNWKMYASESFHKFCAHVYLALKSNFKFIPKHHLPTLEKMVNGRWLQSYTSIGGLKRTMKMMDDKATFQSHFTSSIDVLEQNYDEFNQLFNTFFPDMVKEAKKIILRNAM